MNNRSLLLSLAVASCLATAADGRRTGRAEHRRMDLLEVPVPEGLPGRCDARRRLPRRLVGEVRRLHRPRRQGRLRRGGRGGQLRRRVRLRALVRADRPRPRLARDRHHGRQAGCLRVRPVLRPRASAASGTRRRRRSATSAAGTSRLPADWVFGGSTSGMTSLDEDLRTVDVGYDRDRYGVDGKYFWGPNVVLSLDYKRDERNGFRSQFGSFGSTSTQLLKPLDDSTDRVDAAVRYQTEHWFAELSYNGSFYNTKAASLKWTNPFAPGAARRRRRPDGARTGQRLQRDRAVGRLARPAGQHDRRSLRGDRQGHAGRRRSCPTRSTRTSRRSRCRCPT